MALSNSKKDIVLENIDKIKEWISEGITMQAIAENLGMSKQTLYVHLRSFDSDTIKKAREPAIKNLENSMYNAALGGVVQTKQYVKLKHIEYNENGKKAREWEEIQEVEVEEYVKPDTTAGIFLLKNWAKYMNEPAAMDIRKKELELKEKQVDATVW